MKAFDENKSLKQAILETPEARKNLTDKEIDEITNPEVYSAMRWSRSTLQSLYHGAAQERLTLSITSLGRLSQEDFLGARHPNSQNPQEKLLTSDAPIIYTGRKKGWGI